MSKTKRLLSVTLAIAMIILSAFSAFAEDTETVVETVGAMSVAADSIENDDTTFDVNVKISFNEDVTGPHNIITLTCDKFNLTNVELGDVAYTYTGSEEVPDIGTVQLPQGKVTIAEDGVKNVNWATGKVLIEAPVDVNAPLVSEINLTATFTLKTDVALVAGETLDIAVANDDMADANEAKLSISSGASVVTVHGAGTTYGYDETNHWHACVVEGCAEHTYDVAAHTMSDYVANEDGTTETATCTDNCGYSVTRNATPEHTHVYEWVVTTPATDALTNGEREYKCECGDVGETQEIDIQGRIVEYDEEAIYINTSSPKYNTVSLETFAINVPVAGYVDYINALSNTSDAFYGCRITGSDYYFIETSATIKKGWYTNINGLSVQDMGIQFEFETFVQYTEADGDVIIVYGESYNGTYIDLVKSLIPDTTDTDDLAMMNSIDKAYDAWIANGNTAPDNAYEESEDESVATPTSVTSDATAIYANSTSKYYGQIDIDDFVIYFPVAGYVDYINALSNVSDAFYGVNIIGDEYDFTETSTVVRTGWKTSIVGLSVNDFEIAFTFTPFVQYTDANNTVCRVNGAALEYTYIDMLKAEVEASSYTGTDSALAEALVELYDAWAYYMSL